MGEVDRDAKSDTSPQEARGERPTPRDPRAPVHRVLDERYELLEEMGRGGAAVVYRAFDRVAGESVAIKVLRGDREAADEETMVRRGRELRAARRVTHPGVVRLHDLVTFDGRPAFTMELVEGETLHHVLARGPRFDADRLVALLRNLADALAASHAAGVVHRDLKPANIILRRADGRPMITDFGISRFAVDPTDADASPPASAADAAHGNGPSPPVTLEGTLVGTPAYMAPEQLEGLPEIGQAADVYAFGLIAWEAATGRALDARMSIGELLLVRCEERTVRLETARADLPRALSDVVARCLRCEPSERFPSARELRAALDAIGDGTPSARPKRRAWGAALAAIGVLGIGAIGATALHTRSSAPQTSAGTATPTPARATPLPAPAWSAHIRQLSTREQNLDRPALSPDGRSIVVPSSRAGHWDIWLYDRDGDAWRALTDDDAFDASPQFIDAGRAVAFYSERGGKRGVFRAPVDGSSPPALVEPAVLVNMGASRDGNRLFFSKNEHDLWMYDFAAGGATLLTTFEGEDAILGIASDEPGERVVVSVQRRAADAKQSPGSANELYVLRVADRSGSFVTSDSKWHGTAAFVPGEPGALVSSSRRGGLLNVWKLDGAGAPVQLTAGAGDDIYATPAWDGKSLLYVHDQTVRQLFIHTPKGPGWRKVTHETIDHQGPVLDVAGKHLLFATYDRDSKSRQAWEADGPDFDPPRLISLPVAPIAVTPTPDGKRWVVLTEDEASRVLVAIDRATLAVTRLTTNVTTTDFSISADGARLTRVDSGSARFVSLDPSAPPIEPLPGVRAIAFSPARASEVALLRGTTPGEAEIEIRNIASGRSRRLGQCADSARIAWAPGGGSLWIVPSLDKVLRHIDVRDGRVLESLTAAGDNTLSLAVASDGTLVSESTEGQSRLFLLENFDSAP